MNKYGATPSTAQMLNLITSRRSCGLLCMPDSGRPLALFPSSRTSRPPHPLRRRTFDRDCLTTACEEISAGLIGSPQSCPLVLRSSSPSSLTKPTSSECAECVSPSARERSPVSIIMFIFGRHFEQSLRFRRSLWNSKSDGRLPRAC